MLTCTPLCVFAMFVSAKGSDVKAPFCNKIQPKPYSKHSFFSTVNIECLKPNG